MARFDRAAEVLSARRVRSHALTDLSACEMTRPTGVPVSRGGFNETKRAGDPSMASRMLPSSATDGHRRLSSAATRQLASPRPNSSMA